MAKTNITPQEVQVWYILPTLRKEFAKAFIAGGLKQKEAAKLLGITEAAVSQYLKSKRAKTAEFSSAVKQEIKKSAAMIVGKKSTLMEEIQRICNSPGVKKTVCDLHRKECSGLSKTCCICGIKA
jgi:predicted transcriptional regulator